MRDHFSCSSGSSMLYRQMRDVFTRSWMLYIPVLQWNPEGGQEETYWLLLEYLIEERYLAVVGYGQITLPVQTEHRASLQLEDGRWWLRIPSVDVEFDPGRHYWLNLEVVVADTGVRILIIDYGLIQ